MNYIDLFAGAGGLSEGFVRAGFRPIAHVEMDEAACFTLKTRVAYHYLKNNQGLGSYISYLKGEITRKELYDIIPAELLDTVFCNEIGAGKNEEIFEKIDAIKQDLEIDLIVGGPPCQAYSLMGRARDIIGMNGDKRNYLFFDYALYLKKYQPKMFVFENVAGLKSADDGWYYKTMLAIFKTLGYRTKDYLLNANDFGVLQSRKRVLIIGWKEELNLTLEAFSQVGHKYKVKDLFGDLPSIEAGGGIDKYLDYTTSEAGDYLSFAKIRNGINVLTQHIARPHNPQDLKIYKIAVEQWNKKSGRLNYQLLPGDLKSHANETTFLDRFKVVADNLEYTQTLVAHIAKDGHYYIHPSKEQNRSISVREAARIQSFPDDYYFEGVKEGKNRTAAFKQIGNAVAPLMAEAIAYKIQELI